MIVVTLSNWRNKLKMVVVLAALVAVLLVASSYILSLGKNVPAGGEDTDRSPNGSLKVNSSQIEEDPGWWGGFVETLKGYYQE